MSLFFKKYVEILEGKDVMSTTYSQMVQEKDKVRKQRGDKMVMNGES